MSRRNARKNAFVLLFQMEFNAAEEQEQMTDLFFAEQDEVVTEEDKAYTMAAVEGTRANLEAIDAVIDSFAKGWNTQRMNRVDLAILRLAVYELKYSKDVPVGVVINEAVELAKKYSSDEAPAFINGVLGKIASA
ncbi:n utilization substance protein B homolog [Firmicutes bacterium CAG:466]|uniref:transcription antitermination factor NusB n=1 Tax=Anaerotignum sp. TaxID=2039241 RepID=UPI000337E3BF|nr:transcription antitermination factor NusB [Anaerotignum sp.]CDC27682.1 n utilization substance protein B homolog [Firmicutes bacterium CAG:466]